MIRVVNLIGAILFCIVGFTQDIITADRGIYQVVYSQKYEQPLVVKYKSTNRPTNVNRGTMDFYIEKGIKTSDAVDYANNDYDKGHLAPAATFSDNMSNLKLTFSYLNCALQHKDLNRKQWKLLEETERIWDNTQDLGVEVEILFNQNSKILPTGATIPNAFAKHIYFTKDKQWKCYQFPNTPLTHPWGFYQFKCRRHQN